MNVLLVDVIDRRGQSATAEIAVRRDTVEIRFEERIVGIAERDLLGAWLRHPEGVYAYDDVTWFTGNGGVGLEILELVPASVLSDDAMFSLRERI